MDERRISKRGRVGEGAPTLYTPELAARICERIAAGEPLSKICADQDMPGHTAVAQWLHRHSEFAERYARAREDQADTLADEIVRIADEQPPVDGESGRVDAGWVQWQRTRLDARKWTAAKLRPRRYGDRLEVGGEIGVRALSDEQMAARITELQARLAAAGALPAPSGVVIDAAPAPVTDTVDK